MSDLKRIRKVINWLLFNDCAINDNDLALKMGYTKSSFSQIVNGKVPVSDKFIDKMISFDKNINKVWIISGIGSMINDNSKFNGILENSSNHDNGLLIEQLKNTIKQLEIENKLLNEALEDKKKIIRLLEGSGAAQSKQIGS